MKLQCGITLTIGKKVCFLRLLLFLLHLIFQEVGCLNSTHPRLTLWNLHGAQDFYPCRFIKSSSQIDNPDTIECDINASAILGDSIPIIHPEGRIIREFRIYAEGQLTVLTPKAFENVGANLQRLLIQGGNIKVIRREAFLGLKNLQILEIRNAPGAENLSSTNGLAGRLFTADGELKYLKKLKVLILENVDLSDGLAAYSFYDMSRQLEVIEMAGNKLETINPYTFEKSEACKTLKRVSLERQSGSLDFLNSAYRWARDLGGLTFLSLSGNDLSNRTLDFGYSLNSRLRSLKIENCSLIEINDDLLHNFKVLEEVYIGENKFTIISMEEAEEKLRGLKNFPDLQKLSLRGNKGLIYQQPKWFRKSAIKDLDYTGSLIRRIGSRELPEGLQKLHLESTFLEEIDPQWSIEMTNFSHLYLNGSFLKAVRINGFEGNWQAALEPLKDQLKVLGLSQCKIISHSLQPDHEDEHFQITGLRLGLHRLRGLEHLDLSGNYLTHIPQNALNNMPQLNHLNLSNNHLQTLLTLGQNFTKSENIQTIQYLDLTNNALSSVLQFQPSLGFNNHSIQSLLGDRGVLKLSGNPIICDCRIRWLIDKNLRVDNFTCTGKNSLTGRGFHQLMREELENGSKCIEKDFLEAPDPIYPFRPVRVFGYDLGLRKVYFAVKGPALRSAWRNVARTASNSPAYEMQKLLAKLNNMTPEVISTLQKNYLVFEVAFWPVGEVVEMKGPLEWQVVEDILMQPPTGREYLFSVQPINLKRPQTVCFRNALERRNTVRSTLCQIFQPSELCMTASIGPSVNETDHIHAPLWLVILATASAAVFITCVFWVCIRYKCCQEEKKKHGKLGDTTVAACSEPINNEGSYDKLENYYLDNSMPNLYSINERPELPKRARRSRLLPQPLIRRTETGSLGDLVARRYYVQSRMKSTKPPMERRMTQGYSITKMPLSSPRLPRPITYQSPPKQMTRQPSIDENGYVRMNVENDEYLEASPEKRRRWDNGMDNMMDSYILGVSRTALTKQKSVPVSQPTTEAL